MVAVLLSQQVSADDLGFDDHIDIPTVISATRLQQSILDTPAAITVIDRAMIRALGARELPDILRLVPGMVVGRESGSEAFVGYHGTSADGARRMQVLVDGRSIYEAALARVDWIGLPLDIEDIERIEVVRGPNSATYGANSFFGVVNIITRSAQDVPNAEVLVRGGDDRIADGFARLSLRGLGGDWAWSAFHREDSGFDIDARKKTPFNDDKAVDGVYGKGQYATANDGQFTFLTGFSRMVAEQARRNDTSIYREQPVATLDTGYAAIQLDQPLSSTHRLQIKASVNSLERDEPWYVRIPYLVVSPELGALFDQDKAQANAFVDDPMASCTGSTAIATNARLRAVCLRLLDPNYTNPRDYTTNQDYTEQRRELDISDLWVPLPNLRMVLGANASQSLANSLNFLNGDAENHTLAGFGHVEWRLAPTWLLNIGGYAERDAHAGSSASPRAALSWQFQPNQVVRLVHSRAVRTPDIFEDQADAHYYATTDDRSQSAYDGTYFQSAKSTGQTLTERIRSNEVSYFAQYSAIPISLDVRLFRDDLDLTRNQLEIDNFILSDYEHHLMQGAEISSEWRPSMFQRLQLNYAFLDIEKPPTGSENTDFVPKHSGSAVWAWYDPIGWRGSMAYGFYNNLNKDLFFDRLDLHVGRALRVGQKQILDLGLSAQIRLSEDAELRRNNGVDTPQRIWASLGWRY